MINSVLKAVDILQLFSPDEPRLTLAKISSRLSLPKSTTHNLLNTLASRHFIEKAEDGRYALGPEILALTQAVRINVELRDLAAPLLRELAEAAHESVYLAILDGDYALYIYAVESSARLRARTAVGDRAHLHCTSVGKAMLSALPQPDVMAMLGRTGLPTFTNNTISNEDVLFVELAETATRGYSTDCSEHEPNSYCIGAPIFDRRGHVVAACSVSGTDPAILGERLPELSARVMYSAQEIARYVGYLPTRSGVVVAALTNGTGSLGAAPKAQHELTPPPQASV